jgi:heme oxygenase
MLINKLRERTKATHEALEHSMFPFIKNVHDISTYAKLLQIFYGYYKPLQNAIDVQIDQTLFPDYPNLRKTEWILEDLTALGQTVPEIPLCKLDFYIASHAAAMGALYVMEGSTLGGKIICKTIAINLEKDEKEGFKFFNGYGNETGGRWKTFLASLDSYSDTNVEDAIIDSANNVFVGFKKFMEQNL